MSNPAKILILTADAGFGHRSAARAVHAALEEQYGSQVDVRVLNPLEDKRAPFFLRDSQSDYDAIVRNLPDLYRVGYDASNETVPSAIAEVALGLLLLEVMQDLVKESRPDVILTTYPLYQAPLLAAFILGGVSVPLYTVVTDLVSVHRLWFNRDVDACLVPTEVVRDLALDYGLPAERVHLTGIPVHPNIALEKRPKEEIRAGLGWETGLTTLLAVGSRRVEHLMDALNVVNHFGAPFQLAVVAGKDEELYHQLKEVEWHIPTHLYEYVTNMPELMHASDAIICKAGGLIVTESLACGLPMLLVDVIPGQETGNADYAVQGGAGALARTPLEMLETLGHWNLNGGALLQKRSEAARRLGKPLSAFEIADLLWKAAQTDRRAPHRPRHSRRLLDYANKVRDGLKKQ